MHLSHQSINQILGSFMSWSISKDRSVKTCSITKNKILRVWTMLTHAWFGVIKTVQNEKFKLIINAKALSHQFYRLHKQRKFWVMSPWITAQMWSDCHATVSISNYFLNQYQSSGVGSVGQGFSKLRLGVHELMKS